MSKRNRDTKKHVPYSKRQIKLLQVIYIVASIVWVFLIYALGVFNYPLSWIHLILILPLVIYGIAFLQVCKTTQDIEDDMFSSDILALGLLFVTIFIRWSKTGDGNAESQHTLYVTLAAFTLVILSIIDIWTKRNVFSIVKHVRSIFQTAGIILLVYLLYFYFGNIMEHKIHDSYDAPNKVSDEMRNIHPIE